MYLSIHTRTYTQKGSILCREGEMAGTVYAVLGGQVIIRKYMDGWDCVHTYILYAGIQIHEQCMSENV